MQETDRHHLCNFTRSGSEGSFGVLVTRYLPLVLATARRITSNEESARDVCQIVFIKFVKKAARIPADLPLASWFHRETHSTAVDHVRSEVRRQKREHTAATLETMKAEHDPWKEISPLIDSAINRLSVKDRALVLLRYFENRSFVEIARDTGLSEDAARMRTNRALEKLGSTLRKSGITTTAAALAGLLPAHGATTVPTSLTAQITSGALASGTAIGTGTLTTLIMTKSQIAAIAAIVIAVPVIGIQYSQNAELTEETASLRKQFATRGGFNTAEPGAAKRTARERSGKESSSSFSQSRLDQLLSQTNPAGRMQSLIAYFASIPAEDIPAALEALRKSAPEWDPERKMATNLLLARWAELDPDAAYASLNNYDFKKQGGDATALLSTLASLDPARAAAWLADPTNAMASMDKFSHILSGTIAREWVRTDPDAALSWALTLPDSQRGGAYVGILGTLAASDPKRASQLVMELPADASRNHVVGEIAQAWARNNPSDALAWAESLDGENRTTGMNQAISVWAQTSPAAAVAYLDKASSGQSIDPFLTSVAASWSAERPREAATWVASQPEGQGKNSAMGYVAWNWTNRDPVAASTWLRDLPPSASRDSSISGMAKSAATGDPERAVEWSAQISNPEAREASLRGNIAQWYRVDPVAAEEYVQKNFPEEAARERANSAAPGKN